MRSIFVLGAMLLGLLSISPALADPFDVCKTNPQAATTTFCREAQSGKTLFGPGSVWNRILNVITFVIGAISLIMVIVGAMRYSLSSGDPALATSARYTIIYALVALGVAVVANALVNFVLSNI